MEYKFAGKISLSDFVSFNKYNLKTSLKGARLLSFWTVIFIVFFLVIMNLYTGINYILDLKNNMNNNFKIDLLVTIPVILNIISKFPIVIFVMLIIIIIKVILNKICKKIFNSTEFYSEEHHFIVDEKIVEIMSESVGEVCIEDNIKNIIINKNVVYIYVALNVAYIIKNAFFCNINEYNNFKIFIKKHYMQKPNGT
jgi:hypothetical protein